MSIINSYALVRRTLSEKVARKRDSLKSERSRLMTGGELEFSATVSLHKLSNRLASHQKRLQANLLGRVLAGR